VTGFPVNLDCTLCPLHHYQAETGQTECVPCPDGTYTTAAGKTNSTACVAVTGEIQNDAVDHKT